MTAENYRAQGSQSIHFFYLENSETLKISVNKVLGKLLFHMTSISLCLLFYLLLEEQCLVDREKSEKRRNIIILTGTRQRDYN